MPRSRANTSWLQQPAPEGEAVNLAETMPSAGWYDDPAGTSRRRWWSGVAWTEHYLTDVTPVPPKAIPSGINRLPITDTGPAPRLTFWQAVSTVFAKYVDFQGRASRTEYWWCYLFVSLTSIVTLIIDSFLTQGVITVLWVFATVVPSLAVTIRRLRDAGYAWPIIFITKITAFKWIPLNNISVSYLVDVNRGTLAKSMFGRINQNS